MTTQTLALLVPLLPLAGFLVNGLLGRRFSRGAVHAVACAAAGLSFLSAALLFLRLLDVPGHRLAFRWFTWIEAGSFRADFSFLVDPLSILMALLVTGVGTLIHIYSTGYMAHEDGFRRFFAYLNLFLCAMLLLVLADNYLLLFVGWEGVGLCSYLLIGFYYRKDSAADAGKKAFLFNRVGDAGFLLGLALLFSLFGRVDYAGIAAALPSWPAEPAGGLLTAAAVLLFVGATGKSAQIPLYVWLPDAMEGPTPVSALIHAATMVTAGVYLVARSSALFGKAPLALLTVALVGTATAVFAAVIGLFQRDIKRVLAYSTVSQLGFMFIALGVGAYSAGIFHLLTHAFFKALLFLGAGSVIVALHHEQDLARMGGLASRLPLTCTTMWFGTLAIAGIPVFAGFFSKDAILAAVRSAPIPGAGALFALALAAAALTAFYMFRLMFCAFHGQTRLAPQAFQAVTETPFSMTAVLGTLAALSLCAGFLGMPAWLGPNLLDGFLGGVFAPAHAGPADAAHHSLAGELLVAGLALLSAAIGAGAAWAVYVRQGRQPEDEKRLGWVHTLITHKFYVDEIYGALVVKPVQSLSERVLWRISDEKVIDGAVHGWADAARVAGRWAARLSGGALRTAVGWVVVGLLAAALCALMLYLR